MIFVYSLNLFQCLHLAINSHRWFNNFPGSEYSIICIFSSRHRLHLLSKYFGVFDFFFIKSRILQNTQKKKIGSQSLSIYSSFSVGNNPCSVNKTTASNFNGRYVNRPAALYAFIFSFVFFFFVFVFVFWGFLFVFVFCWGFFFALFCFFVFLGGCCFLFFFVFFLGGVVRWFALSVFSSITLIKWRKLN